MKKADPKLLNRLKKLTVAEIQKYLDELFSEERMIRVLLPIIRRRERAEARKKK